MTGYRVWAPKAESVRVRAGSLEIPLNRAIRGWWEMDTSLPPDIDYQILLDERPLPDPRSPFQPQGIHGPSRTVDHAAFPWTDQGWQPPALATGVVYELHIGTFTPQGTFHSAIGRLDYLKQLGITHVELMPVNEFSGTRGWGYDGVDLYAPHHAYGGPQGLKTFVDACHARGLAVILDVVYNHLGPTGNYLGAFGPYFTDRYSTPWGPAVNLDSAGSEEVRRFICDNACMWLRDYHIDGLRVDAVHALLDTSAIHLLEQMADEVRGLEKQLGRTLLLIAESDLNDPRIVRTPEQGGYGMDGQWSDDFHHALHTVLTGEHNGYYADFGGLHRLARALENVFVYANDYSEFRGRRHGRPASGVPASRFLGYLQNHDQVGNRARGERSSHLMNTALLKIGAACVLTAPFVPMLFQGEEWGASTPFLYFSGHEEEWLREAVSKGRREEFAAFGWKLDEVPDPQDPETFACSGLNWNEQTQEPHAGILQWHRDLIRLRRQRPVPAEGAIQPARVAFSCQENWIRFQSNGQATVCNLAEEPRRVPLERPGCVLLATPHATIEDTAVLLPPESAAVLRID